jgi:hypothetical protein
MTDGGKDMYSVNIHGEHEKFLPTYERIKLFCETFHGNGVDADWNVELVQTLQGMVWKCSNSFHEMNEVGFYTEWLGFCIEFPVELPMFQCKFEWVHNVEDDNGLSDHLFESATGCLKMMQKDEGMLPKVRYMERVINSVVDVLWDDGSDANWSIDTLNRIADILADAGYMKGRDKE